MVIQNILPILAWDNKNPPDDYQGIVYLLHLGSSVGRMISEQNSPMGNHASL